MRRWVPTIAIVLAAASSLAWQSPADQGKWVQLFNGKNLDGWTPKIRGYALGEDPMRTFRVEDGILKVSYENYQKFDNRFGHLFYKRPFRSYVLRVEYRFVGEQCPGGPGWAFRNSGAMLHGQDPKTIRQDQDFPVSIEAQLLGGDGRNDRTTNNLCTPGTHVVIDGKLVTQHCISSRSKTYHGDQWVTAEMEVHAGGMFIHRVNGEVVLVYEQPQYDEKDADAAKLIKDGKKIIESGTISLQSESHPVQFRKVEVREIKE